ncbi:hypothetical protein E4U43_002646 [Claviceps pusilla]|uniref:Major facilitator superfamily (MFS) profile domain-containing protein n=1 Tax=Claviceps pusilla TaxID=123648 RepID=A0A9P7N5Y2_9HYPO|nr:hypothetical protein E4U43_002646 [Claviceps pusilla]
MQLAVTYALQFYGKAVLGQAVIFGLGTDLGLHGLEYSWAILNFSFGYMIGTYPISFVAQKYSPRIVITAIMFLWAIIIMASAAFTSYRGMLINRFFLGFVGSGVSPIFMLVTEQVLRSSLWYACSGGSFLLFPFINYGLGRISGRALHPWKYMYLIAGAVTFLWAGALYFLFPDTPQDTKGFNDEERRLLMERMRGNNAGGENRDFKAYQLREALLDYRFWGLVILSTTSCTGSGVIGAFGSIMFNGMGFDIFTAVLLNVPIGALALFSIIGSGYLERVIPNSRHYIIAASCLPVMIGCGLLWKLDSSSRAGRIIGFYLISFFCSAWIQCIGLGISNVAGSTKKAVYAAATFMGYSLGNVIGPLIFNATWGPRYDQSFLGLMICFAVCFATALALRAMLVRENNRREREFGPPETSHGLQDLTDRENTSFRYNL